MRAFRFCIRFAAALLVAWVTLVAGLGLIYVNQLTHPPCPVSAEGVEGYQAVSFTTSDGVVVHGWWRAPRNGAVVVVLGGHGASRDTMLPEAGILAKHGYGVLTLGYRHCAGRPATLGVREVEELRSAVKFAYSQEGVEWVGVQGFSAGGVTAIRGAMDMPEIGAVIAMGNYHNLWGEISNTGAAPFSLAWQIEHAVAAWLWLLNGAWPPAVSPLDHLALLGERPVLLIFGENEAETTHAQEQFAAIQGPKELWLVPGTGHGGYLLADPAEYERRVIGFLDAYAPLRARK